MSWQLKKEDKMNYAARAKFEVAQPICCRPLRFTVHTLRYAVT